MSKRSESSARAAKSGRRTSAIPETKILSALVIFAVALSSAVVGAQSEKSPASSTFQKFDNEVAQYVALQNRLRSEVGSHQVRASAEKVKSTTDMLAAAIQRARPRAKQGDFFDPAASRVIRERMQAMLKGTAVAKFLADINDEPTFKGKPKVHLRFPKGKSMATMPTRVLGVVPELPKELEYRFVGRDLVLRDNDAELILDYVTNALPAR